MATKNKIFKNIIFILLLAFIALLLIKGLHNQYVKIKDNNTQSKNLVIKEARDAT